jgi:hypothetical protein
MKRTTKITLSFSLIHFVILAVCFNFAFILGMDRFDAGITERSLIESVTETLTGVLSLPGRYLWTSWASKNLPNIFEWLLVVCNSLLWGFASAKIYTNVKKST